MEATGLKENISEQGLRLKTVITVVLNDLFQASFPWGRRAALVLSAPGLAITLLNPVQEHSRTGSEGKRLSWNIHTHP